MSNRLTNFIAAIILLGMFVAAVLSIRDDSTTMDELAHLPAGYSYVSQKDMRLNPEHPPLIKDLAGFPLLFIEGINFPSEAKSWREDVNGQWDFGAELLYKSRNPVDKMMFWGRIPMIIILVLLGAGVFYWTKKLFGNKAALLSVFLFSFSPTFLAHGRLVTTDLGAAAGTVLATYFFLKLLENYSLKKLIASGLALGLAELAKFSLILLLPFFLILLLLKAIAKSSDFRVFLKTFGRYLLVFAAVVFIGYCLVWVVYQFHTWNYPPEKQASDTDFILASFNNPLLRDATVWMADKPLLRPAAQYLLGLWMVFQRASGGNTTYFWGEVSASGWKTYFPSVYMLKEPISFHILSLIALFYALSIIKRPALLRLTTRLKSWSDKNTAVLAMLLFIFIYWGVSLKSNLNIGVRHLLPVFPFTIILVSGIISKWLNPPRLKVKTAFILLLLLWQAYTIFAVYPHFLSYFNEIAGGPKNGYFYTVDSNLDWGQDLRRLKKWVDQNGIDKIYVDYFGGGDAKFYLGEKYKMWWGTKSPEELPKGSYLAVSATFLQGGRGEPVEGFNQDYGYYRWLDDYIPVVKIGNSIFVYKID